MKIIAANAQHVGKRANQQDAFGFSDNSDQEFVQHGGVLAVLCDGMGGMALGEQASNAAVQAMLNSYMDKRDDQLVLEMLDTALQQANQAVLNLAETAGLAREVGTTLVAALIHNEQLYWVSVGDSRIYLLRDGGVMQMTEDHNYAMELEILVKRRQISRQQADHDPERQALVSYLGLPELPYISSSVQPVPLQAGDVVLLCSDGLYGTLTPEEIKQVLACHSGDPYALVQAVLAKEYPHQDNITVTMLICDKLSGDTVRNPKVRFRRKKAGWLGIGLILLTLVAGLGGYYYTLYHAKQNQVNAVEATTVADQPLEGQ